MVIKRTDSSKGAASKTVVRPDELPIDSAIEQSIRPQRLSMYIGQQKIKEHLLIHIEAAKSRTEPLGHTLLHGPPGLGKTTLATIIARELGGNLKVTSGPAIEKSGDLAAILTNISAHDILFIDEIHRLRPQIEEVLYSAMEDGFIDIFIGKGPTARSVRLRMKPFTLVGATTKIGAMSAPLRDRFMHQYKLSLYSTEEICQIIKQTSEILAIQIDQEAAQLLSGASRCTPRIANRLVRMARDFVHVSKESHISKSTAQRTLSALDIDLEGLDATDRLILKTIMQTFGGGPVGLSTLAATLSEDEQTLEDVYEPFLLSKGYLSRTPKGRMATALLYRTLGVEVPQGIL